MRSIDHGPALWLSLLPIQSLASWLAGGLLRLKKLLAVLFTCCWHGPISWQSCKSRASPFLACLYLPSWTSSWKTWGKGKGEQPWAKRPWTPTVVTGIKPVSWNDYFCATDSCSLRRGFVDPSCQKSSPQVYFESGWFFFATPQAQAHVTTPWVITITSLTGLWLQCVLHAAARKDHQEHKTDLVSPLFKTVV